MFAEYDLKIISTQEIETLDKLENLPVFDDDDLLKLGEIFDEDE